MTTINPEHINISIQEKIRELRNWQGIHFTSGIPLFMDIEEPLFKRDLYYSDLNKTISRPFLATLSLICYKIWNGVKHLFNYSDHDRLTQQITLTFKNQLALFYISDRKNPSDEEQFTLLLKKKTDSFKTEKEKDKLLTNLAQIILSTVEEHTYTFPIKETNPLLKILDAKVSTFSQKVLNPQ